MGFFEKICTTIESIISSRTDIISCHNNGAAICCRNKEHKYAKNVTRMIFVGSLRFLVWNLTHRSYQASAKAFSVGLSIKEPINVLIGVEKSMYRKHCNCKHWCGDKDHHAGLRSENPASPHTLYTQVGVNCCRWCLLGWAPVSVAL